uniref:TF-B3 domain-containing protein n=1 Tax=Hordeum vulgare subsp. vulgare TaxID=112509 RepID=A0A8I6XK05_HORVV
MQRFREEKVTNAGHGIGVEPYNIYTRGVVLNGGEEQMLGLTLHIQHGYIGLHFVHHLTPTNITSKLMKIPKKIFQWLNLAPEGVVSLCMGVGDVMQVGYDTNCDGLMVLDKDWDVFATQYHIQVDDVVVFNFKESNVQGINITCIVIGLRLAQA